MSPLKDKCGKERQLSFIASGFFDHNNRSEGGLGGSGSVLRGAGGEKENRGVRNMDGLVGSRLPLVLVCEKIFWCFLILISSDKGN